MANILLVVNAVINKYGIWRFGKIEVLRSEGLAECWRSLPTFDPSRKKKFFHFLSLVVKYHLINLTKKDITNKLIVNYLHYLICQIYTLKGLYVNYT